MRLSFPPAAPRPHPPPPRRSTIPPGSFLTSFRPARRPKQNINLARAQVCLNNLTNRLFPHPSVKVLFFTAPSLPHSLTPSLFHSLLHSLTHPPTHSLTHSLLVPTAPLSLVTAESPSASEPFRRPTQPRHWGKPISLWTVLTPFSASSLGKAPQPLDVRDAPPLSPRPRTSFEIPLYLAELLDSDFWGDGIPKYNLLFTTML